MTDARYVLVARNRVTKELEPIHPGHVDRAEAERVAAQLMAQHGIRVDIRDADEWEREQDEANAELFCPACGLMKEDCDCRCTKCGELLHGVEYEDDGEPYCEQHWRELPGNPQEFRRCYDCEWKLDHDEVICPRCGAENLIEQQDEDGGVSVCPHCGQQADEDEDGLHYCPRCDLQLDHLTEGCDECETPAAPAAGVSNAVLMQRAGRAAEAADGYRDVEWADSLDELLASQQERLSAVSEDDEDGRLDALVPDLDDEETRAATLDLLLLLQGVDFGQGQHNILISRMLTAVHNLLHDEWAAPTKRPTVIDHAEVFDSKGTLALQVNGWDELYLEPVPVQGLQTDQGREPLTSEQHQQVIDAICAALGVADEEEQA